MHKETIQTSEIELGSIQDGSILEICGRRLHVFLFNNYVRLHDLANHDERTCTINEINELIEEGGAYIAKAGELPQSPFPAHFDPSNAYLIKDVPNSLRSDAGVQVWLQKIRWLQRIKDKGYTGFQNDNELLLTILEIEHECGEQCPFKPSTLYKAHLKLKKNDGDYRNIFPNFARRGGGGKSRLPNAIETIIGQEMDAATKPEYGLLQASRIYQCVEGRVIQLQRAEPHERYQVPSLPTITRRLNEKFSAFEIFSRKHGEKRAKRKFRMDGARVRADRPLDIVEFDDKDTACFLIDERTWLPWGRAHITAGVDQATGSVLGINISEHARSTQSAWAAFEHAIFPKDPSHPDFQNCKQRWEPYGHIGTALLDNASYNATSSFQASILDYGSEIEYSRPHKPTNKSVIEHWNHEVMEDHICHLPGWAGAKEDRGALDHGLSSAVYSLNEFRRNLMAWITDVYSNKTITSIGKSPREAWMEAFLHMTPHLPRQMLPISLAGTIKQVYTARDSGGILRKKLRYQSPQLDELKKRHKKDAYVVRYAPHDLSYLFVQEPQTDNYLRVPCIEDPKKYEFITDYQQSLILKFCYASRKNGTKAIDLYEGRKGLIESTRQNLNSKSMRKRKVAVRTGDLQHIESPLKSKLRIQPPPISSVERFVNEIASFELEDEEYEVAFAN